MHIYICYDTAYGNVYCPICLFCMFRSSRGTVHIHAYYALLLFFFSFFHFFFLPLFLRLNIFQCSFRQLWCSHTIIYFYIYIKIKSKQSIDWPKHAASSYDSKTRNTSIVWYRCYGGT